MDSEEKLVLDYIKDAGNLGTLLTSNILRTQTDEEVSLFRYLDENFDDKDWISSNYHDQSFENSRRKEIYQNGKVCQGESRFNCYRLTSSMY
jgi:hypothetical protein